MGYFCKRFFSFFPTTCEVFLFNLVTKKRKTEHVRGKLDVKSRLYFQK